MTAAAKTPLLSIVIPAFNEEKTLGAMLAAVFNQKDPPPFEVIVVDNNSTDDTASIARSHGARVVLETRQGITYARLRGLLSARANIIVSLDADTLPPENWLTELTAPLLSDPSVLATYGPSHYPPGKWRHQFYRGAINLFKVLFQRKAWPASGHNLAYRRQPALAVMRLHAYLGIKYYEDTFFCFKLTQFPGLVQYVGRANVLTSDRRVQHKSLWRINTQWVFAMVHYFFQGTLPAWAYREHYGDFR